MSTWLITLMALWTFPIFGYIALRLTRKRLDARRKIIKICFALNTLAAFGLLTTISTTRKEIDWIIVSSLYLTPCILLWFANECGNKLIKVVTTITMIGLFGIGYFSGTVGALGVGFVTAEYSPRVEKWLGDGTIYKETLLGNAISDYRGKRIEIYKTIPWLPILEWRIIKKEYFNLITYAQELTIDYKPDQQKIYLSSAMPWGKDRREVSWSDILSLNE